MASTRDWFETRPVEVPGPAGVADDLPARDRILATAERLFAERGFDRTSTARIAAESGVPHGLIFYHFKTKMDLLLAVIREDRVAALDDLLPPPPPGAGLHEAVAELWRRLCSVLGEPSPVRKILIQEVTAHPEIRQRALELHSRVVASVAGYLAEATGGVRTPERETAARLLTITAGLAPLLGEPSLALIPPGALATLISDGLRPGEDDQ